MIVYILAKVISIHKDYIIVEYNNCAFKIETSRPNEFKVNEVAKIYIAKYWDPNPEFSRVYGFKSEIELNLFYDIKNLSHSSPRIALKILQQTHYLKIIKAIACQDITQLENCSFMDLRFPRELVYNYQSKYQKILSTLNETTTTK